MAKKATSEKKTEKLPGAGEPGAPEVNTPGAYAPSPEEIEGRVAEHQKIKAQIAEGGRTSPEQLSTVQHLEVEGAVGSLRERKRQAAGKK